MCTRTASQASDLISRLWANKVTDLYQPHRSTHPPTHPPPHTAHSAQSFSKNNGGGACAWGLQQWVTDIVKIEELDRLCPNLPSSLVPDVTGRVLEGWASSDRVGVSEVLPEVVGCCGIITVTRRTVRRARCSTSGQTRALYTWNTPSIEAAGERRLLA